MTQSTVSATFSLNHRLPRPPGAAERQDFAVEDERSGRQLASRRLDDVGQAPGDVGETARPDSDSIAVAVELDARAVVLVLERGGPAVGLQYLLEILRDLREHRQQRNARAHGRRRE